MKTVSLQKMAKLGSMAKLSLRKKEDPLAIYDDITIGNKELGGLGWQFYICDFRA